MKRISERRWKHTSNYLPSYMIAEVLDEARNDFPKAITELVKFNLKLKLSLGEACIPILSEKELMDLLIWFVKWFGEAPQGEKQEKPKHG